MIFKSDLIEAINGLSHDLTSLSIRVRELEDKISEGDRVSVNIAKTSNAKKQPRTKDGKFAKKNK